MMARLSVRRFPVFLFVGPFQLDLPAGAELLCVMVDAGVPYLYAMVDSDREPVRRRFTTFLTDARVNHPLGDVRYVASFVVTSNIAAHLFELP